MPSRIAPALLSLALLACLACDASVSPAPAAPAKADENLTCGLFQATNTEAMLALSKCAGAQSIVAADAKGEPIGCASERDAVVTAHEKYIACIDGQPGSAGGDIDAAIKKMDVFADDMCRCRDKACAEKVTAAMVEYSELMQKKYEGKAQPRENDAQKTRLESSMKRLTECTTKAMGGWAYEEKGVR